MFVCYCFKTANDSVKEKDDRAYNKNKVIVKSTLIFFYVYKSNLSLILNKNV